MTKKEHEKLVEQAIREYGLQLKREKDEETALAHEKTLNNTVKNYRFTVSDYTTGGRKNRALAVGECILQASEKLERESMNHHFAKGTLGWNITEERVKDDTGHKGYKYTVTCVIATDEPAYTQEEITEKVKDLRERLAAETEEMFAEDPEEEQAEEQPAAAEE